MAEEQVRISELPPASQANPTDMVEVSQGTTSRHMTLEMLKTGVQPDLSEYLKGIVGGAGIVVVGGAPVPTVALDRLGGAGTWGDSINVPEVTVDDYGRVTGVVLIPIPPPDLSTYAPIDSPAFTGQPTAPTPPPGDSSARLVNTSFLHTEGFITDAPAVGKTYGRNDGAWIEISSITVGVTPPDTPTPNDLWWNNELGQLFIRYADPDSTAWVPAAPGTISSVIPPGSSIDYFGSTAPAGWYLCDGSEKDRMADAPLFAVIGTTYGAGDGSTTFNLPDCRGRVVVGKDDMGVPADRVTSAVSGIDGVTLGASGGEQVHTLIDVEVPATPLTNQQAAIVSFAAGAQFDTIGGGTTPVYNAPTAGEVAGGGGAHQNMQPSLIANKLIKR